MENTVKKRFATEQQFQAEFVLWFSQEFPSERRMLHCNMNNSWDKIEGNKAKAMGVTRGVSDLELLCKAGVTWYIELKLPGKTQSEDQIKFMNKALERGHKYILFEYIEDLKEFIWQLYND